MMAQITSGWEIIFYQDRRGRSLILDFIEDLPALDQAKIYNGLRLLREFGNALGMPPARHVEGKYGSCALEACDYSILPT
jgi:hypothetical protein